jgi:hypothetical protein
MAQSLSTVHKVGLLANAAAVVSAKFHECTSGSYALSFFIVLSLNGEVRAELKPFLVGGVPPLCSRAPQLGLGGRGSDAHMPLPTSKRPRTEQPPASL